ncbi:MAG TPA: hypothetical protein VFM01_05035 [Nakamurella sp.]|nr:hypothetical protein [Nakamurella sp.]
MTDAVAWALANLGPGALIVLVVLLILSGRLVPRRALQDMINERDDWKAAAQAKDATIAVQARQIDELQEAGRVATAVMQALPKAAGK